MFTLEELISLEGLWVIGLLSTAAGPIEKHSFVFSLLFQVLNNIKITCHGTGSIA